MTAVILALVFLWATWLVWHGRASSPRRRMEQARWDYLLERAVEEKP